MTRHSCPRVSFLGPDSTRQNVDPTRPSIADQKSESTRPDPSPYPSPMASHKKISTNFNAFKIHWHVSLQILQNINTSNPHSKNYTGFLSNKESITKSVFSHTNLHIFTIVFHFRHVLFLHDLLIHLFFPFHMSDHHLATGLSRSSVHDSRIHSLLILETRLLCQYSVPDSNSHFFKITFPP